jgi:hypothetical protein
MNHNQLYSKSIRQHATKCDISVAKKNGYDHPFLLELTFVASSLEQTQRANASFSYPKLALLSRMHAPIAGMANRCEFAYHFNWHRRGASRCRWQDRDGGLYLSRKTEEDYRCMIRLGMVK